MDQDLEEKKSFKPGRWILVLIIALGFGAYQLIKIKKADQQNEANKAQEVDPLSNQLVEQNARQTAIESVQAINLAEERMNKIMEGKIAADDPQSENANTPQEEVQIKQTEARLKLQTFKDNSPSFVGIISSCSTPNHLFHMVSVEHGTTHYLGTERRTDVQVLGQQLLATHNKPDAPIWLFVYTHKIELVNAKGMAQEQVSLSNQ